MMFPPASGLPRRMDLRRAVRRGGQSYAAYSTCEGGLLFEMSGLREVAIHPSGTSVRFGDGALCGAVEIETVKVDRAAVLGQCPSVGAVLGW